MEFKREKPKRHKWTDEQAKYLKEIAPGRPRKEITRLFNERFNLNLSFEKVRDYMNNNGIKNNLDTKFKKGITSKDQKIKDLNKPIGVEITWCNGYKRIKLGKNKWVYKHRYIWEQHFGEIPAGHSIIFLDKNKENFDINNLAMVNRKELLFINDNNFLKENSELSQAGVTLAKLLIKTKELETKRGQNG